MRAQAPLLVPGPQAPGLQGCHEWASTDPWPAQAWECGAGRHHFIREVQFGGSRAWPVLCASTVSPAWCPCEQGWRAEAAWVCISSDLVLDISLGLNLGEPKDTPGLGIDLEEATNGLCLTQGNHFLFWPVEVGV